MVICMSLAAKISKKAQSTQPGELTLAKLSNKRVEMKFIIALKLAWTGSKSNTRIKLLSPFLTIAVSSSMMSFIALVVRLAHQDLVQTVTSLY